MPLMAKHAQESAPATRHGSSADVWLVLTITGAASVALQVWHAVHSGRTAMFIAVIVGLVPAAAAMGLSHVVAGHRGHQVLQYVTFGVMLAAMAVAISAIAAVVRPVEGPYFAWVFGLVIDAAALACVWVLLTERQRRGSEATALGAAQETARNAEVAAREEAAKSARLEEELAEAHAALEALRAAVPVPRSRRSSGPASRARKSAPGTDDTQDMTTELRALQMLDAHPELRGEGMGSELGERLGVSKSYGRKLHRRLTSEERPAEALQERGGERPAERGQERTEERS